MPTNSSQSFDREQRLDEIIAAYYQAREAGAPQDHKQWVKRYPDFASELAQFFAADDQFNQVAEGAVEQPQASPLPATVDYQASQGIRPAVGIASLQPAEAKRQKIAPGVVFAGDYSILDMKAGGMGRVYIAEDMAARKRGVELKVAIKTVADYDDWRHIRRSKGAAADATLYGNTLRRFHREAESWVRLGKHDNIIWAANVLDVGGKPYLVMEYANGGDLASWIRQNRITVPLAINFAIQFCEGMLHAVRTSRMVHRDIKPANVLIKDDRILKIADFGLSKAYDTTAEDGAVERPASKDPQLSIAGGGTLAYMAPEQFESLSRADTRSDIFSFGAMLHEMLTSQKLFRGGDVFSQLSSRSQPIKQAHEILLTVPPGLSAIIARCVAYKPKDRFQSFDEVKVGLWEIQEQHRERIPIPCESARLPAEVQKVGESYSFISLGQLEKAIQSADEGLRHTPDDADLLLNKGNALCKMKRFREGRDCLQRAAEVRPDNALTWSNLSWALLELGQLKEAKQAADQAVQLDDSLFDSWNAHGHYFQVLEKWPEAAKAYARAAESRPHDWTAQLNRGKCLLGCHRYGDALAPLQLATEINPEAVEAWNYLALCLSEMDCSEEALRVIDRALHLNPSNSASWTLRGMLIWQSKRNAKEARGCLERALDLDPNNNKARDLLRRIR